MKSLQPGTRVVWRKATGYRNYKEDEEWSYATVNRIDESQQLIVLDVPSTAAIWTTKRYLSLHEVEFKFV